MSAVASPRLASGFAVSVVLHGGLVAVFLFAHVSRPSAGPPPYMVQLIAAPAGERAIGAVQPEAPPKPAPTPSVAKPEPVKPKPAVPKPKPVSKTPPKRAPDLGPTAKPTQTPATAGGGATGGKGSDVANLVAPGIEFDYPWYIDNIARRVIMRFGNLSSNLVAEVRFVIKRDGSVDPESIRIVTSSRNYSFDQRALGAVEAAANAHEFGALPPGFREDILPVTFRFSPSSYR